jgi:hypothetical protein
MKIVYSIWFYPVGIVVTEDEETKERKVRIGAIFAAPIRDEEEIDIHHVADTGATVPVPILEEIIRMAKQ